MIENYKVKSTLVFTLPLIAGLAVLGFPREIRIKKVALQHATGVFYSVNGGVKGGEILIYTREGPLHLIFDAPLMVRFFSNEEVYQYGAIWIVRYHNDRRGLVIDNTRFTGKFDNSVKAADLLVYDYYALLSSGDYRAAYTKMSARLSNHKSFEQFVQESMSIPYEPFPKYVGPSPLAAYGIPTYGTKIVGRYFNRVVVLIDAARFTKTRYEYYRFDVIRNGGTWRIDKMRTISESQFENAGSR